MYSNSAFSAALPATKLPVSFLVGLDCVFGAKLCFKFERAALQSQNRFGVMPMDRENQAALLAGPSDAQFCLIHRSKFADVATTIRSGPCQETCCVRSKDDLHDLHDDFLWRPD